MSGLAISLPARIGARLSILSTSRKIPRFRKYSEKLLTALTEIGFQVWPCGYKKAPCTVAHSLQYHYLNLYRVVLETGQLAEMWKTPGTLVPKLAHNANDRKRLNWATPEHYSRNMTMMQCTIQCQQIRRKSFWVRRGDTNSCTWYCKWPRQCHHHGRHR